MALRPREAVGLDIGSRTVKIVQLRRVGKQIELSGFGVAEIHPIGERPNSAEELREMKITAIRRAVDSAKITTRQIVSAVAGESVIVRYIQLPDMPEAELKNALQWEAEEYIPFNLSEVNIDATIIGPSADSTPEAPRLDVLLVCARKNLIDEHIALVQKAGLSPDIIDSESFAFLNCYELNCMPDPSEVVGLINIGGDITSISVYSGGSPRFSRDISIGGNTITAAIQQRVEVSMAEAEALKFRRGVPSPSGGFPPPLAPGASGQMSLAETIRSTVESMTAGGAETGNTQDNLADKAIRNTLNNLIGEIRRSVQFFEGQARDMKVGRLMIGGGTARLEGFCAFLERELQLPVEIMDPLRRIQVAQGAGVDAQVLQENKHALSVGIGLALRKVVD
jgi:type IV pilus assembly protein PilM